MNLLVPRSNRDEGLQGCPRQNDVAPRTNQRTERRPAKKARHLGTYLTESTEGTGVPFEVTSVFHCMQAGHIIHRRQPEQPVTVPGRGRCGQGGGV